MVQIASVIFARKVTEMTLILLPLQRLYLGLFFGKKLLLVFSKAKEKSKQGIMWGISISEALCLLRLTKNIWFSTEDFSICFLPQQYLFYSVISVLLVTLQDSFWVCGDVEIS